jgi:hypothetical protein
MATIRAMLETAIDRDAEAREAVITKRFAELNTEMANA